jgi:predicted acyltransferase (DUF342 family)
MIRAAMAFLVLATAGCNSSVSGDIEVPAGAADARGGLTVNGNVIVGERAQAGDASFRTVNGRIEIGEGARVKNCATVNGKLVVGADSETGDLEAVNGSVVTGTNTRIHGHVQLVNGGIQLGSGTRVSGDLQTVNGRIELRGAEVGGDVANVHGDMLITEGTVVKGTVIVREQDVEIRGDDGPPEPSRIVIGPGARLLGGLRAEQPVELYVHESAEVASVSGAEARRFSGDEPDEG